MVEESEALFILGTRLRRSCVDIGHWSCMKLTGKSKHKPCGLTVIVNHKENETGKGIWLNGTMFTLEKIWPAPSVWPDVRVSPTTPSLSPCR